MRFEAGISRSTAFEDTGPRRTDYGYEVVDNQQVEGRFPVIFCSEEKFTSEDEAKAASEKLLAILNADGYDFNKARPAV